MVRPAYHFDGIERPNSTDVPNIVFDELLPILTGAELKVLLYIIRRILGFHKDYDPISFNQFTNGIKKRNGKTLDGGCGVKDRSTISAALRHLEEMGLIVTHRGVDERGENETNIYELRIRGNHGEVVGKPDDGSRENPQKVVGKPYQQNKDKIISKEEDKRKKGVNTVADVDKYFTGRFGHLVQG